MSGIDAETKRKLREMGVPALADALEGQDAGLTLGIPFGERVKLAVDDAHATFTHAKVEGLIRRAGLRYPNADLRRLDLLEQRGLDRGVIAQLGTCAFIERQQNVVFQGFTGSGKSYLGSALAKQACQHRYRAHYIRMPDLEESWAAARDKPGGKEKWLRKFASFTLLVIDEWLLDLPDESVRSMLLELLERRYDDASTVFCTQYAKKDWHQRLGSGVHADAIMDRIVHNTIWIETGSTNMREHGAATMAAGADAGERDCLGWRSPAISGGAQADDRLALNRNIRWRWTLQILNEAKQDIRHGCSWRAGVFGPPVRRFSRSASPTNVSRHPRRSRKPPGFRGFLSGRYWDRTSDLFRVREARYRCANRPRWCSVGSDLGL